MYRNCAGYETMVRDDVSGVNTDVFNPAVRKRHDEVERTAMSMGWSVDVLNQTERRQEVG